MNKKRIILIISFFAVMIVPLFLYAASVVLHPTADGIDDSNDWQQCGSSNCYLSVDETSGSFCGGTSDGDSSYIENRVSGANQTFEIDESDIPNGSIISEVIINTCYRQDGGQPASFQSRFCVNGLCTNSGNDIAVNNTSYVQSSQSFPVDIQKIDSTNLEIGVSSISSGNANRIRLSTISSELVYTLPHCNDGIDNDEDGQTDYPDDPGCSSEIDNNETDLAQCEDGIDNDGDGQIDFPEDNGCSSLEDDDETDPSAGVGEPDVNKVRFSGHAYPNGTLTFIAEDGEGNTCDDINEYIFRTNNRGRFHQIFDLCFDDDPVLGIQATDQEGKTININFINYDFSADTFIASGIVFPPTVKFNKNEVLINENITTYGYSVPNSDIGIITDGTFVGRSSSNSEGYWEYEINTQDFGLGSHSVRARLTSPYQSGLSDSEFFEVNSLPFDRSDLNNDSEVGIHDLSIFLFRWNNNDIMDSIDFNDDGIVDITDLSIFLTSFSN